MNAPLDVLVFAAPIEAVDSDVSGIGKSASFVSVLRNGEPVVDAFSAAGAPNEEGPAVSEALSAGVLGREEGFLLGIFGPKGDGNKLGG